MKLAVSPQCGRPKPLPVARCGFFCPVHFRTARQNKTTLHNEQQAPHHDLLRLAHLPRREPAAFRRSRSRQSLRARAERRLRRACGRHRRARPHDRPDPADALRGLRPCGCRRGRSRTLHGDQARGRRLSSLSCLGCMDPRGRSRRHGARRRAIARAALAPRPHHEHHEPEGADLLPRLLPAVRRARHDGLGSGPSDGRAGLTFILATFVVFSAIAWAAGAAAKKLQSPAFSLWLNCGSAALFLALAVFTVLS